MRLVAPQRGTDCGPVAVYNLARLLRLKSARGGYRANRARLAKATRYNPKRGCSPYDLARAILTEVTPDYTLKNRHPSWPNVIRQLRKASWPPVGVAIWRVDSKGRHVAPVWANECGDVLGANVAGHPIVPLYIDREPTVLHPRITSDDGKLSEFWQVVNA